MSEHLGTVHVQWGGRTSTNRLASERGEAGGERVEEQAGEDNEEQRKYKLAVERPFEVWEEREKEGGGGESEREGKRKRKRKRVGERMRDRDRESERER